MSITGNPIQSENKTSFVTPFSTKETDDNKTLKFLNLFSFKPENFIEMARSNDKGALIMSIISEDKDCAKSVDKYQMAQMILKVAKEFDIDPVVLTCIIRKETHFNHVPAETDRA